MGSLVSPIVANLSNTSRRQSSLPHPYLHLCGCTVQTTPLSRFKNTLWTLYLNILTTSINTLNSPSTQKLMARYLYLTYVLCDGRWWKPTHTDQYLNFTSHHPLVHKQSVVCTLTNRAKLYVTTTEDQQAKLQYVHNALRANSYKEWVLNAPLSKPHKMERNKNKNINSRSLMVDLPYVQGTSEILARIFKCHGVNM